MLVLTFLINWFKLGTQLKTMNWKRDLIEQIDSEDVTCLGELIEELLASSENASAISAFGGKRWVKRELDSVNRAISSLESSRPHKPESADRNKTRSIYRLFLRVRLKMVLLLNNANPKEKKHRPRSQGGHLTRMMDKEMRTIEYLHVPGNWALRPKH